MRICGESGDGVRGGLCGDGGGGHRSGGRSDGNASVCHVTTAVRGRLRSYSSFQWVFGIIIYMYVYIYIFDPCGGIVYNSLARIFISHGGPSSD